MIQLNLLPDIKIEYIKGQRLKRLAITSSLIAVAVSAGLLILLFSFVAIQKKHVSDLDKDIDQLTSELESTPELESILSVQSQLNSLPALYDGRPAVDRLPVYLDQTTPAGVRISKIIVDFTTSTFQITGKADSLELVYSYVDTLKFTAYSAPEQENVPAFKDVVLTTFGRDDKLATYTVTFTFDPTIFDITKQVTLAVPSLETTRAEVPTSDLFVEVEPTAEGVQ